MIKLDIYSDYVCPWCYVGQGIVSRLKKDFKVNVDWKPFFLHPEVSVDGIRITGQLLQRYTILHRQLQNPAHDYGLPFVIPYVLPNSRRALEATEYARVHGKHEEFHHAVFHKFYGEGQDIGKWEILRAVAEMIELDPDEMQSKTEAGDFQDILNVKLNNANTLGIVVAPTYVINDKDRIEGVQPYAEFTNILKQLSG